MEYMDAYTFNREKTGRQIARYGERQPGDHHIVVHVLIFNEKGQLLIQQRHANKKSWPSLWDFSAAGTAQVGETSQEAASRELFEELGIDLDLSDRKPHLTVNFYQGFDDFYLVKKEVDIDSLVIEEVAIQDVRWASLTQVQELIAVGHFFPYFDSYIPFLFDMQDGYGYLK